MDLRKLKSLIRTLKKEGVAEYEEGDLKLRFADTMPAGTQQVASGDDDDLDLPAGVVDPRKRLREIYARQGKKPARGAA
jgi:hypothetical protein